MEINSLTSSQVFLAPRPSKSGTPANAPSTTNDQAVLSTSGDSFTDYVQQASSMPEVRSEVVDAFKSRIASGHYPAQQDIENLSNVIGGSIVAAANSGVSYPGSQD